MWRRIISPEDKMDWVVGVIGIVLGAFSEFVNVVQRIVHPRWLQLVCVVGMAAVIKTCYLQVRVAWQNYTQDRTKGADEKFAVECKWCSFFRFCLFTFLAVLVSQIITDPREKLAKSGAQWTVDAFFDAIRRGDDKNVKLFLLGGMTTDVPDSQARPLPVILALNSTNGPAMLDLLVASGLDVNHSYEVAGALQPQRMTLLSRAIERSSEPLVEALIKHHVDVNSPIQTFGAMGSTRDTYPLTSAIYRKQLKIAELLLDAGANPAAGDYAAYREAQALREKSTGDAELRRQLDALIERLEPHGSAAARIESTLRLQAVEEQLKQVALGSLRVPPGSPERRRFDAEYDQLQIERTKLRSALNAAAK